MKLINFVENVKMIIYYLTVKRNVFIKINKLNSVWLLMIMKNVKNVKKHIF